MRRILVTGGGGQLATCLAASLPSQGFEPESLSWKDAPI
jgi:dTDP-4-dehydrorhamnose reductase